MIVSPSSFLDASQLASLRELGMWTLLTLQNFLLCLQNAILALDSSALDIDQVENLIKFCPTKEEMETLRVFFFFFTWV